MPHKYTYFLKRRTSNFKQKHCKPYRNVSLKSDNRWQKTNCNWTIKETEFLIICAPWKRDCVQFDEIEIGDARISSTTDARNLGVIMDKSLNMEKHIQKLCQTSIAQLWNITDLWKYLTQKLIHAFITSWLDYCNSLLYDLPLSSLKKLQKV